MPEDINKQIRIPRAKIQEIRDVALKISIDMAISSGLDRDLVVLFRETVCEQPINEELIPTGVVIYIFTIQEAVIKKFSGYQHVVPWLMFPFIIEFKKIPQVAEQLDKLLPPSNKDTGGINKN